MSVFFKKKTKNIHAYHSKVQNMSVLFACLKPTPQFSRPAVQVYAVFLFIVC